MSPAATAYIALGANLGDREAALREAVHSLSTLGTLTAVSSLYETDPVGYRDQPPFLNAVVELQTSLAPQALMQALLAIEASLGRQRTFRNAPRTIDLDLLLYDDLALQTMALTIPHPRLHERAFVLVPLAEIGPLVTHPTLGSSVTKLLESLPATEGVRRFASPGWEISRSDAAERPTDR